MINHSNHKPLLKPKFKEIPLYIFRAFLFISSNGINLIILILLLTFWQTGSKIMTTIATIFNPTASPPKIDASTIILQQVQQASELTTAVFVMETVVPTSQDRKIGEFVIATTKLLYIAHGEVRAGVDLHQLTAEDIKIERNKVIINLPAPQILDSKIDVRQSQVYDYNRGFLSLGPDVAPQLQTLAQQETLKNMVNQACSQGFLEEANQKAETTLIGLLNLAGYEKVEIKTTPPERNSCQI
jgi:hypothetical protein